MRISACGARSASGCGSWLGGAGRVGLAAVVLLVLALPASAEWRIYTSADLGYSVSKGEADGQVEFANGLTVPLGGNDTDVSPFLGGAIGLAIPMDEIASFEMPRGWRLPDWDVRAEIEAIGLRNYKYKTDSIGANSGDLLTELDSWSVMSNFWLDVPLRGLYRPISWTSARLFGRWRLRWLKHALDRTTFDLGGGVGVANLDVDTQESATNGSGDEYNFAWQVGAGFGYQLTDRVKLAVGYRYLDPGTAKYRLKEGGVQQDSFFELDPEIHEARATLRVNVWDFDVPWR
jgi:hypothetical protein